MGRPVPFREKTVWRINGNDLLQRVPSHPNHYRPAIRFSAIHMTDLQFCPECGTPLLKDHIICQKCGLLLPVECRESAFVAKIGLSQPPATGPAAASGGALSDPTVHSRPETGGPVIPGPPAGTEVQPGACEACVGARDAQCSVCGRKLCDDHLIRCGVCNKIFCSDHIQLSCSLCTDPVCPDCLFHCPSCQRTVGADHLLACSRCGQVNCELCTTRTGLVFKRNYCRTCLGQTEDQPACEECGEILGESRGSRCVVCGKRLCPDHTVPCSICNKPFCREHIHRNCSLCDNYVCPDCLLRCPRCDAVVGADHLHECARCGQVVCKNCITESGTILKKKYCTNLCGPSAEEPGETGLLSRLMKKR